MARIRSTKPEFWTDRSLALKLTRDARLFYKGLWNFADEHGRISADPYYLKGQIFPYESEGPDWIEGLVGQLEAAGKVVRYSDGEDPYLFLRTLHRHQRLEPDKVPSRLPAPPVPTDPANTQVTYADEVNADKSARDSVESEPDADEEALFYVAGGREQVAGSRGPSSDEENEVPPAAFDEFWKHWPRKVDKEEARTAFTKAVTNKRVDPAVVIKACAEFAERCRLVGREKGFIPYPATWLNKQRWNDDLNEVLPLPPQRAPTRHETYRDPSASAFRPPK